MSRFPAFRLTALFVCLFLLNQLAGFATDVAGTPPSTEVVPRPIFIPTPPFPQAYYTEQLDKELKEDRARPYWVATELEHTASLRRVSDYASLLLNDDILAFYGTPLSKRMGILGVHSMSELDGLLTSLAKEYDAVNGDRGVKKAFYVIYGMAWPQGEIGILSDSRLIAYIEYALANDILVFIDHQIGKYTVEAAVKRLLPFLRYPNVHLAIDPEWRTLKPMEEIGFVSAAEVNKAQEMIETYLVEHGYPGERLFVIHQFNAKMIAQRENVRTDFGRVRLVHCADGFGIPAVKRSSYYYNARAVNMPIKAFKLFYKSGVPGTGYDFPLMKPEEVMSLEPRPMLIMYQ